MTFTRALESVKKVSIVDCVMVDINCCLKVVFKSGRSKFFSGDDSLDEAMKQERIQWNIGKELFFRLFCLCFMKTDVLCFIISFWFLLFLSLTIFDLKTQIQFFSYNLLIFCLSGKHPSRGVIENRFFNNISRLPTSVLWIKCNQLAPNS